MAKKIKFKNPEKVCKERCFNDGKCFTCPAQDTAYCPIDHKFSGADKLAICAFAVGALAIGLIVNFC